jgi:predicted neutral ceramidase superfamily lipid hydrolase
MSYLGHEKRPDDFSNFILALAIFIVMILLIIYFSIRKMVALYTWQIGLGLLIISVGTIWILFKYFRRKPILDNPKSMRLLWVVLAAIICFAWGLRLLYSSIYLENQKEEQKIFPMLQQNNNKDKWVLP